MKGDKYYLILGFIGLFLTVLLAVIGGVILSLGGDEIVARCFLFASGTLFAKTIVSFIEYRGSIKQDK